MAGQNGKESFWDDDSEGGSIAESGRASPGEQREAVHIGVQQEGVFAKAENGTDDTFSYIKRSGLKLRNAQGSAASLDTLDEADDGQARLEISLRIECLQTQAHTDLHTEIACFER